MKIYNFGREFGTRIHAFNSKNLIMTRILNETNDIHVGCMHIDANGIVGLHQASISQLFLVVSGEGVVKGKEGREYFIDAGFAAFWEAGEWHETRTDTGLTAIIIECQSMNLKMKEVECS
jgi:mannose-6-phosphate isomerase-like protein (cupin superfamily)